MLQAEAEECEAKQKELEVGTLPGLLLRSLKQGTANRGDHAVYHLSMYVIDFCSNNIVIKLTVIIIVMILIIWL